MITPKVDNVKTIGNPDFNRNADGKKQNENVKNDAKKEKHKNSRRSTDRIVYVAITRITCFLSL